MPLQGKDLFNAINYNVQAIGKIWNINDIPDNWLGKEILLKGDFNKNNLIDTDEKYCIDWALFTQTTFDLQTALKIGADGQLGPGTLKSLREYYKVKPELDDVLIKVGNTEFKRAEKPVSPPENLITLKPRTDVETVVIYLWNNYGKAISDEAVKYGIPVETALSVFCVESKTAYDPTNGLLIIRYEPHIFLGYSKKSSPANRSVAHNQATEWDNIIRAAAIHEEYAFWATSFGLPQLMGFNYKVTPYKSAIEMAIAFQNSCEAQVAGFFEYVKVNNLLRFILKQDWDSFVSGYNGAGQVAYYKNVLLGMMSGVNSLKAKGIIFK